MIKIAQKDNYEAVRDGIESSFNESLLDQKENYGVEWILKAVRRGIEDPFEKELFASNRVIRKTEWIFIAIKEGVKEAIKESIKDGSLKINQYIPRKAYIYNYSIKLHGEPIITASST